ncbi:hypothetical protein JCM3766R1_003871 [Sporobolomyces carnicolor]
MPPRKTTKVAAPAAPLPKPNAEHPCHPLLCSTTADLATRSHPPAYHVFFNSTASRASSPPPKKKQKKNEDKLPAAIEYAWEPQRIQDKLIQWFDGRREDRKMPWRKDVVPSKMTKKERSQRGYEVWVSEIMLQQTQVATVISYFDRWMLKFPTVVALSKATVDEVNAVWTGLGYYSRAKRLLDGAQTVVRDYNGLVPETVEELLTIEGIGPYSAGAINSIAFGKRSALVDGNVTRVLSRVTALHAPATAKSTTSFIWALADLLVPENGTATGEDGIKNKPGSWNQGLMELGATVCSPKNPKCGECPISEECLGYQEARFVAHRNKSKPSPPSTVEVDLEDLCDLCAPLPLDGDLPRAQSHSVELYPMAKERKKQREEETAVCLVEWTPSGQSATEVDTEGRKDRKVLVMKRPEKGLLAGLLEFPSVDLPPSIESTPSGRSKHLASLLDSLLSLPANFRLSKPAGVTSDESTHRENDGALRIESLDRLDTPVVHVYSHIIRTYHVLHVVLTSPSLPKLKAGKAVNGSTVTKAKGTKSKSKKKATSDDDEEDADATTQLVQSLAGTGKWIDASEIEGESLGGAMFKVWEMRQGGGSSSSNKAKAKNGKAKAKGAKETTVEKGQKSLMGFFGGGGGAVRKVTKDESDEDVVIIEEKKDVKVEEKKVYKKRTIAPSSDEEE